VDDDESIRESLPDLLGEFGFEAPYLLIAEEFTRIQSNRANPMLDLDIAMPGMTGPHTSA